jgi:hypothetical protein
MRWTRFRWRRILQAICNPAACLNYASFREYNASQFASNPCVKLVHSTLDNFVILSESWQLPEADAALDGGHTILLPSAA